MAAQSALADPQGAPLTTVTVQLRDSPAARIASVTWPPRVVAAPSSSSVKVVRARRGTASARRPTSVVRIGGTAVVGMARAGEGGRAVARPDTVLNRRRPPRLAPRRRPRHAHAAERVPVNFSWDQIPIKFTALHQARVADHVRGEDGGEPAVDAGSGHGSALRSASDDPILRLTPSSGYRPELSVFRPKKGTIGMRSTTDEGKK